MQKRLAGRLKWERTDDGVRVQFPRHISAGDILECVVLPFAVGLFMYLFARLVVMLFMYYHPHPHPHLMTWWGALARGLEIGLALSVGSLLARATTTTTLTLNPMQLKIVWRSLGVARKTRVFSTASLSELRFAKYMPGAEIKNNRRRNEMRFSIDSRIEAFASGITEKEADYLIARMMEVYPFSKNSRRT